MQKLDLQNGLVAAAWRENPIGTLFEMAKRAPGQALSLDFGPRTVLLLQGAEQIHHVLRTRSENYRKNFGGFQSLFGESRLTVDGPKWEFLQKLSQPHMNEASTPAVALSAYGAFAEAAESMLASREPGVPMVVDGWLNRAAARVASEVVFGFHDFDIDQVLSDFRTVLRHGGSRNWNFAGSAVDTAEEREQQEQARLRLHNVVEWLIAEAANRDAESSLMRDIVLGEPLGADAVSEICTLLFAGFDTSATALSWALFLLAAAPDLQNFLRTKVREADRSTPEAALNVAELLAFQNEVLRIFPPIPVLGRLSMAADSIEGIAIPGDQVVLISLLGLHHDARYFPAPAQVRLKRYVGGQLNPALRGHFLPFGDGRRACGGGRVANVELTVALATMIDKLEVNIADQEPIHFEWTASLRREGGQRLLVRPAK